MTLTQLKHMSELARTGSFIKSAENLFLTQPALSRSIKSLEDDLGAKLFDRQGRQSTLTVFGEEILRRSQVLLDLAKELKETNRNFQNGLSGQIKIGMGSGPGAMLMTPLLQHTAIHYPHLHIEIARGTTEMLVESLRSRRLDALVVDGVRFSCFGDIIVLAVGIIFISNGCDAFVSGLFCIELMGTVIGLEVGNILVPDIDIG